MLLVTMIKQNKTGTVKCKNQATERIDAVVKKYPNVVETRLTLLVLAVLSVTLLVCQTALIIYTVNGNTYYEEFCNFKQRILVPCASEVGKPLCSVVESPGILNLLHIVYVIKIMAMDSSKVQMVYGTSQRPSAHFMLDLNSLPKDSLKWRNVNDVYQHPTNLSTGNVSVPASGMYTIYGMYTITSGEYLNKTDVISHQIIKKSYDSRNTERTSLVLLNRATERTHHVLSCQTSFVFGQFYLRKGDAVVTLVSDTSAVYRFSPTSYWGLFML